jgi:hypothetical protein
MCGCGKSSGGGGFGSARIGGGGLVGFGAARIGFAGRAAGGCGGGGCGRAGQFRVARGASTFGGEDFAGIVPYHLSWAQQTLRSRGVGAARSRSVGGLFGGSAFAPGRSPFSGGVGGSGVSARGGGCGCGK